MPPPGVAPGAGGAQPRPPPDRNQDQYPDAGGAQHRPRPDWNQDSVAGGAQLRPRPDPNQDSVAGGAQHRPGPDRNQDPDAGGAQPRPRPDWNQDSDAGVASPAPGSPWRRVRPAAGPGRRLRSVAVRRTRPREVPEVTGYPKSRTATAAGARRAPGRNRAILVSEFYPYWRPPGRLSPLGDLPAGNQTASRRSVGHGLATS